jgi:arabinofuranosyltransferase
MADDPTPDGGSAGAAARADARWRRAVVACALVPPLALALAELYLFGDLGGFPLDDSWIHLVFARHLAHGDGLVFNPGQRVAGSTAPLWTALLSLAWLLPGPAALWAKAAGAAAQAASAAATFAVARRLRFTPARAGLAGILVALSEGLVLSALSGMEVGLFTFLTLAGLARHLAERAEPRRAPVAFLLFALAALTRPEGLLLPLLAAADRLLVVRGDELALAGERARKALAGLALAALVVAPVALVYLQFSGSPLPTTLAAKSSGPPRLVPELRFLEAIFALLFAAQPLPALLAAGGAVVAVRRLGGPRDAGVLLPAWTFGLPVAAAMLSSGQELLIGNFGRYFFPLLPPVVLLGLLALDELPFARWRTLRVGALRLPVGALALLVLVGVPALRSVRAGALYLRARANVEDGDGAAAAWLAAHVPADAPLALCDIGLAGWRLPNPILDLGGIVHPERTEFVRRMERERGLAWPAALRLWLEQKRPEYVVVYPSWFPLLEREPERFPVLHRIRIADNVALAGDELVVYATPWTRNRTSGER